MEKKDKVIVCKDCGKEFTFTVRDQEFYEEKGFTNEPTRCKDCRIARKQSRDRRPSFRTDDSENRNAA